MAKNEYLLIDNKIHGVSGTLKDDVSSLIRQEPNSRLLALGITKGPPVTHLVYLHNIGKNGLFPGTAYDKEQLFEKRDSIESKFDERIAKAGTERKEKKDQKRKAKKMDRIDRKIKEGNLLMRWGEPLAVYDPDEAQVTVKSMRSYLQSKGYFNCKVSMDTALMNVKKRMLTATYNIQSGDHFYIDSIQYLIKDTVLKNLIFENNYRAPLQKGYYDQETLTDQRDYIYDLAVDNGYFEFSRQYISFRIDSTALGQDTLLVTEVIQNPKNQDHHKIYYLDSIVFTTDASLVQAYSRTNETYKDVTFRFGKHRYSKKVLRWRISLDQDDRYSRSLTLETQRQLSYLDNFKFVNINYDTIGRLFVANIFTAPFGKYQISFESGMIQNNSASQLLSPFLNVGLKNRNAFRALEIINVDLDGRLEGINTVSGEQTAQYSSRQASLTVGVDFPQFLFPFGQYYKKKMSLFDPKTRLSFGLNLEQRLGEYTRTAFNTALSYFWQIRSKRKHTFTPFDLSLIDSKNTADFNIFLNNLEAEGNTYANAFRSAYVNSTSYQLEVTIKGYDEGKHGIFFSTFLESGGQFNNLVNVDVIREDSIETYQFFKVNLDARKIQRVKSTLNIAYRLNVGIALPYGPNDALPYEKYFLEGGAIALGRGNQEGSGPGAFGVLTDAAIVEGYNEINFAREQPGELLVQGNFEFRQKLVGFLEAALFVDAGNVWLIRGSTVNAKLDPQNDDGKFRFREFFNEVAVGSGIGLRFDLSFLILRFDLGFKMIDPAQAKGRHFVGSEIFRNFSSISESNIGIGYPF